jgi:hypothetical protein
MSGYLRDNRDSSWFKRQEECAEREPNRTTDRWFKSGAALSCAFCLCTVAPGAMELGHMGNGASVRFTEDPLEN